MTTIEVHSLVKLYIDRFDGNYRGDIQPEFLDILLQSSVYELLDRHTNRETDFKKKGLQEGQKRLDDIEELTENVVLPTYIGNPDHFNKYVYVIMPTDYYSLYSDYSTIGYACKDIVTGATTSNTTIKTAEVDFKKDTSAVDLYKDFKLEINDGTTWTTLFQLSDYDYYVNGIPSLDDDERFYIVNMLLEKVNREQTDVEVYWERYTSYKPNKFIVKTTSAYTQIRLTINSTLVNTVNFVDSTLSSYNISDLTTWKKPNRLTDYDTIDSILDHYSGKTRKESPVSSLEKGVLKVFHNNEFVPTSVGIKYMRKPVRIDSRINQVFELAGREDEIAVIAARRYLGIVESKNYQQISKEQILTD